VVKKGGKKVVKRKMKLGRTWFDSRTATVPQQQRQKACWVF
jgi:hypothetical protein